MKLQLPKLPQIYIDDVIKTALAEDINYIDVATDLLFSEESGEARFVAKADGVLAGIDIAMRVFEIMDDNVMSEIIFKDGQQIKNGDVLAHVSGNTAAMLKSERTALNILQHMSGIASLTRLCVNEAEVSKTKGACTAKGGCAVADTRKTLPGLRSLQKYAVLCGGGSNHRYNLSQAAMLKDNHIDAYGGISGAIEAVRSRAGHTVMVEVEVRDLQQLTEAIAAKADIVMLDNMSLSQMREAVGIAAGRCKLEASGNITLANIREVAETGVDIISMGALTHSVTALDISMKWS
jgi:nicotinate-nucleotide pyrophosphorylase (carboxylating)